jgi:lysyl-tRNA synthetase, class II
MTEENKATEHQDEREVRIAKIQKMKAMGVIPFAQSFDKKNLISDIIQDYETKDHRDINDIIPNPEIQVQTAGRVMLYRTHGKLAFAKLLDSTAQIQLMFHRDNCKIIVNDKSVAEIENLKPGT